MTTDLPRSVVVGALLVAGIARAGAAHAAEPAPAGPRLYLRFDLGGGPSTFSSPDRTVDGSGPIAQVAIGVRVVQWLAVYLESFNQLITSHEAVGVGADQGLGRFQMVGPGLIAFVPSVGVHLAETIGFASLSIPSEKGWTVSTSGYAWQTELGKDWQISERLRLGASAQIVYGTLGSWTPLGFGLLVSLTYD